MRFSLFILLILPTQLFAQQVHLSRTINGMASSSGKISISNNSIFANQSIGQQTISKVSVSNNIKLRQGYLQPILSRRNTNIDNENLTIVYPNPFSDKINIALSKSNKSVTVEIYHSSGMLRHKKIYNNEYHIDIDTSTLLKGLYLLRISTDRQTISRQVLKN